MMKHSLFSFFSGAGFLDLGFEAVDDFQIQLTNEPHLPFYEAYCHGRQALGIDLPCFGNFDESVEAFLENPQHLKKIMRSVRPNSDFIGFIGGPPCPDFSIGGKNRGRNGDQGALSAAYIQLIVKYQPDYFLFENVKGLWRTKKHRAFYEELKQNLHQANYITTERVINAIEYGVPQDRDRIILIGFKREILQNLGIYNENRSCLPAGLFPWQEHIRYDKDKVFALPWPHTQSFSTNLSVPPPDDIIHALTVEYWFDKNHVDEHPNAKHHFQPRQGLKRFQTIDEGDDSRKSFKRLHRWRYSPTAAYGNNEVHLHPYKIRRISAAEALAIQSLPEGFVLPDAMSLTNMFKTIGNGVPYLAAKALALSIKHFLEQGNDERTTPIRERFSASN